MNKFRVEVTNGHESFHKTVEAEGKLNAAEKVIDEYMKTNDKKAYWPMKIIEI